MPKNKRIVDAVSEAKGALLSATQIAEAANIPPGERKALQQRLRDLVREGVLEREGKRFRIPAEAIEAPARTPTEGREREKRQRKAPLPAAEAKAMVAARERELAETLGRRERRRGLRRGEVVGLLTLRPEGYGFVKRLEGPPGDDVFLPAHELRDAMNGDEVLVRVVQGKFGRAAGVLVKILSHRRQHFLGIYGKKGREAFVVPVDPSLPRLVPVPALREARVGQVVKVAITEYPSRLSPLRGEVVRVVGEPDDPIVEVLEVAYAHGFAEEFPAEVRAEAERLPSRVRASERKDRRDLRELSLVTIDSEDARDFDDAVFVERGHRGGYRLVVAIADVAHYVEAGSALDREALARATSVYFPNHVLPMLPEKLSNGICSLNPDVERLCMVADLRFDARGRPVGAELYEGLMRSHARLTYEQVARVLEGETPAGLEHLQGDLRLAGELAAKLRARRIERGALDFDLPEAKAVLDERMLPVAIERQARTDAHRLIEEFMLAANEAVARDFSERGWPTIYRVHDQPDPEKLERFAVLARAVGHDFETEGGVTPLQLAELLRKIEGSPQQKALNALLLRSLMQAIYQPENIGHFGLASENYLHFTSPIRRYPDLMVHRLLKERWARGGRAPRGAARDAVEERLEEIARQSTERERAATEAERDIDQYFKCLFIQGRVGEEFDATVISVTDFGFFAELDAIPIEGLVRAEELGSQWEFDELRYRLVFPGSGRSFGMGDAVRVSIAEVDLERRQISLALVADAAGEAVEPRPRRPRKAAPLASAVEVLRQAGAPSRRGKRIAKGSGAGEAARGGGKRSRGPEASRKSATQTRQRPGKRERLRKR